MSLARSENPIRRLNPLSDTEAVHSVSARALADLEAAIVATPVPSARQAERLGRAAPRRRPRRGRTQQLIALTGVAALAASLALLFGLPGAGDQRGGPVPLGPTDAQALTFTRHDGQLIVIVRNPFADPARYRADFAAHHLDIKLQMIPASPSIAGTVVYIGGNLTPITAKGRCTTSGGGACPVGVKVPLDYHGFGAVAFGRAARPGERYETAGSASAPGEALYGIAYRGRTVASVLARLRARHVTVPQYRYTHTTGQTTISSVLTAGRVPQDWYVHGAIPWAPAQVLLMVGPSPNGP